MANSKEICDALRCKIGPLFVCSSQGEYCRIRTLFLYPDGDYIDLFCKVSGDVITVTDLAETTGWLRMQTAAPTRNVRQERLIEAVCMTHGIKFQNGMLQARCRRGDSLANVVMRVGQAVLRVSDLWFTFRPPLAVPTIVDEVADYLIQRKLMFSRAEKLAGKSGNGWKVDFRVRTSKRRSLVYVLSKGSRQEAHRMAEHVLATWYDLRHLKSVHDPFRFVSLIDDTVDVWRNEDVRLVGSLSTISMWSRRDEFVRALIE